LQQEGREGQDGVAGRKRDEREFGGALFTPVLTFSHGRCPAFLSPPAFPFYSPDPPDPPDPPDLLSAPVPADLVVNVARRPRPPRIPLRQGTSTSDAEKAADRRSLR